jgi:hypothetical protein
MTNGVGEWHRNEYLPVYQKAPQSSGLLHSWDVPLDKMAIEATINAPRISATGRQNPLPITNVQGSQVISYFLEQLYHENSAVQKLHYGHCER